MNKQLCRVRIKGASAGVVMKNRVAVAPLQSCYLKMSATTRTGNEPKISLDRIARMEQPKLHVKVPDRLGQEAVKAADRLWPGQGQRAVNRLTRDALDRYLRYIGHGSRDRS